MNRRSLLGLAGAAALLLAGCTPGASTTSASTSTTGAPATIVGLSYIPDVQFSPAYLAVDKGLFTAAGATVTLRHHGSSESLFTALLAGDENFVVAGGDEMMQARAGGADLQAVSAYYGTYPVAVIVKDGSTIKTLADLKGKKIGVPGRYGETWYALQLALKTADLTEADVTIQEIGYTAQAAIAADKVDAVMGFTNSEAVALNRAGVPVRTLAVADNPPLVSISLITTTAYAKAHPAIVKAVATGLTGGLQAAVDDPAGAVTASVSRVATLTTDAAKADALAKVQASVKLIPVVSGKASGKLDAVQWAAMATFMKDKGLIATAVDPTAAMTNDYQS